MSVDAARAASSRRRDVSRRSVRAQRTRTSARPGRASGAAPQAPSAATTSAAAVSATSSASGVEPFVAIAPWRSSRAASIATASSGHDGGSQADDPLGRLATSRDATRGRHVEDDRADGTIRPGTKTQHQPVAGGRRHRRAESEDRGRRAVVQIDRVPAGADDGGVHGRGPEVRPGARPIGQRPPESDEDPIGLGDAVVVGQDRAAVDGLRVDAGEIDGGPARTGGLDRLAVDLQLAGPDRGLARDQAQTPRFEPADRRAGCR